MGLNDLDLPAAAVTAATTAAAATAAAAAATAGTILGFVHAQCAPAQFLTVQGLDGRLKGRLPTYSFFKTFLQVPAYRLNQAVRIAG